MTDQPTPTPTPRTDAEVEELSDERFSDLDAYMRMTKHARELERELAACVPGMELIARMLSDERALADRLAAALEPAAWLCGCDSPNSAEQALAAWKEASREA